MPKFAQESKPLMDSGRRSSKMTSSCKWPISVSDFFVLIGWGRISQGRVNELIDSLKAVAFPKTVDGRRHFFSSQFVFVFPLS